MSLIIRNARVVPCGGRPVLPCADVVVDGGRIVSVTEATRQRSDGAKKGGGAPDSMPLPRAKEVPSERSERGGEGLAPTSNIERAEQEIDAAGRVLMPAFVDAHTHAMWAGDRLAEWEMKLHGASYLEILQSGGGILSTVRAVRAASEEMLVENLTQRLAIMMREGTTTVEVKSGYGLTTADELKMLRAMEPPARAKLVIGTALLGHAIDPEQPRFVDVVIEETLPSVSREFPGITIDAYCETGAWSVHAVRRLFERAIELGHPVRLHADQFNSLGGVDLAIELGARSVDHLEASDEATLKRLATSRTYGVMLPACGFHMDGRYANARAFLDAGGKLVLASNCNPGSAPTSSMPFVIALAVRKLGLSVMEAIEATTATAADLLGLPERGCIAPGMLAELVLLRHRDERQLGSEFGGNPVDAVICAGRLLHANRIGFNMLA